MKSGSEVLLRALLSLPSGTGHFGTGAEAGNKEIQQHFVISQRLHVAAHLHAVFISFVEQGVELHILVKGEGVHDEFLDALRHISLTFRPHGIVEYASRSFAQECA